MLVGGWVAAHTNDPSHCCPHCLPPEPASEPHSLPACPPSSASQPPTPAGGSCAQPVADKLSGNANSLGCSKVTQALTEAYKVGRVVWFLEAWWGGGGMGGSKATVTADKVGGHVPVASTRPSKSSKSTICKLGRLGWWRRGGLGWAAPRSPRPLTPPHRFPSMQVANAAGQGDAFTNALAGFPNLVAAVRACLGPQQVCCLGGCGVLLGRVWGVPQLQGWLLGRAVPQLGGCHVCTPGPPACGAFPWVVLKQRSVWWVLEFLQPGFRQSTEAVVARRRRGWL